MTFGPELKYVNAPAEGWANLPPSDRLQFFSLAEIGGPSGAMTVRLMPNSTP